MEYHSLLLLLVLAATVCSVKSECPSSEDIYPCKCKVDFFTEHMTLTCQGSKTTLTDLKSALSYFSKDEEIVSIRLRNLALGTIPSKLFDGLAVKKLYISNCTINFEDGELPLKGLEDSLQFLTIKSSLKQKDGPLNLKFGHLDDLEILELSGNKITDIGDDLFTNGHAGLHTLILRENRIKKIGEKAFENLKNLNFFELSGNKFGSLRRNMIPTSDHLDDITLSNNGLTDLPEDIFTSLPSLEYVFLHRNKITTLDRKTWETIVDQLKFVHLADNPIQCDSEMEWLFGKGVHRIFSGKCAGPEGKEGLDIKKFIKKESHEK